MMKNDSVRGFPFFLRDDTGGGLVKRGVQLDQTETVKPGESYGLPEFLNACGVEAGNKRI
jgi:hypothetical protein